MSKHDIQIYFRCGDHSKKAVKCNFKENSKRKENILIINGKWIKKNNSLNCLPDECCNIFPM